MKAKYRLKVAAVRRVVKQWSRGEEPSGMYVGNLNTGSEINAEIEAQLTNTNDLDNATNGTKSFEALHSDLCVCVVWRGAVIEI